MINLPLQLPSLALNSLEGHTHSSGATTLGLASITTTDTHVYTHTYIYIYIYIYTCIYLPAVFHYLTYEGAFNPDL